MTKFIMMPPQDAYKREWAKRLETELSEYQVILPETDEEVLSAIVDADAVYGWVSPEALQRAKKLQWIQNPDAGPFPGYYYQALIEHPVTICNPRGIYFDHISQHIMMFVLGLSRGLPYYMDAQHQRRWDKDARKSGYIDLAQATALIVGVGGIGHETARLCAEFGMKVIGVDPRPEYELSFVEMHAPTELDIVLPRADFVIATTPHTPETEGMWNKKRFDLMKQTAYFINIGRGKTMKLADLIAALENGDIAGCGLDVFEVEPLPAESPLWALSNVMLTPHIAVKDAENIPERRFEIILENARRFASGTPLRNVVNKAAWY
ncbi:MAG: D-2-hydroxyacid dehydrogenase [Candidatus Poribacteria bacterium]|nr:D-2-hydroxyacid dehydrogenase [Candidatus Poribacteria bacterium]